MKKHKRFLWHNKGINVNKFITVKRRGWIHHAGRQTSAKVIRQKPLAPSLLSCSTMRGDVTPLTLDGIRKLVVKFGAAAARARETGFELIEVHGAHGYLVNQFLSGFSNIRTDAYGGNIEGRTRFAREIVHEIRDRLGKEFPLSFKISAQEFVTNGLTVDQSIEIFTLAKVLEIKDDGVVVADTDNHESFLEAQRVVIAVGSEPNETILDDIQSLGYEVYRIGDCVKPRTAKSAIYEGAVLGRSI